MTKKKQTPFKECLDKMIDAYNGLHEAKEEKDNVCNDAYEGYTKTIKVGDDSPPSIKAIEKVAKALSDQKVSKLSQDLDDIKNALVLAKKNDAQGDLFEEG